MTRLHKIDLTGDYETTTYDVARRLLAEGADPGERLETRRHGILSMSGIIGKLAKWQVVFAATGPHLARHKGCISGPLAANSAFRLRKAVLDALETVGSPTQSCR